MMQRRKGFILVLVVAIIGIMSTIVMRTIIKLTVFNTLSMQLARREQAKLLAWSGVEIAIAQICKPYTPPTPKQGAKEANPKEQAIAQTLFAVRKLCTILNRWQPIPLTEAGEQVDGSCMIYIACEAGKLHLNKLSNISFAIAQSTEKSAVGMRTLYGKINAYLEKEIPYFDIAKLIAGSPSDAEKRPLYNDIAELLTTDLGKHFEHRLFIRPPDTNFALFDLFTLEENNTLQLLPCALSSSVAACCGLKAARPPSAERWKRFAAQAGKFQSQMDLLAAQIELLYGVPLNTLPPELISAFTQREDFEPKYFSVISYGTYGNSTAKLYVIVQKKERVQKNGKKEPFGCITKVYWIYD